MAMGIAVSMAGTALAGCSSGKEEKAKTATEQKETEEKDAEKKETTKQDDGKKETEKQDAKDQETAGQETEEAEEAKGEDGADANKETVTLKFWKAAANDDRNAWWENTIAEFEKAYPEIKIEYLGVAGDDSAFNQKLDMAFAAGEMPDVISSYCEASYITRGLLEPLDTYFANWEYKDQIPEVYLDQVRAMDFANEDKKLYTIPFGGNVQCMYARADILKEKGMEIPDNWEDFFAAAEAATDKDQGLYGYIIHGGSGGANALEMLMYSYSGITDFFIDDKCTLNDPKNVEFVEKYLGNYGSLTSEDDINKGWPEMAAQYQSGKAVLMMHNLGSAQANYDAFKNDENVVKAVPLPKGVDGKLTLPTSKPTGNMITAASEHKEEAWKFVSWLAEKEQASAYEQMMGNLPVNSEAIKDSWVQDISYMKMGADAYTGADTQFCNFPYYLPNFTNIETNYAMPNMQKVLLGQMSVQDFMDGWARELQKEYDKVVLGK